MIKIEIMENGPHNKTLKQAETKQETTKRKTGNFKE